MGKRKKHVSNLAVLSKRKKGTKAKVDNKKRKGAGAQSGGVNYQQQRQKREKKAQAELKKRRARKAARAAAMPDPAVVSASDSDDAVEAAVADLVGMMSSSEEASGSSSSICGSSSDIGMPDPGTEAQSRAVAEEARKAASLMGSAPRDSSHRGLAAMAQDKRLFASTSSELSSVSGEEEVLMAVSASSSADGEDGEMADYESAPRRRAATWEPQRGKQKEALLPVKSRSGALMVRDRALVPPNREAMAKDGDEEDEAAAEGEEGGKEKAEKKEKKEKKKKKEERRKAKAVKAKTPRELEIERRARLLNVKQELASIAEEVMSDPQTHVGKLRDMEEFLEDSDPTIRKLAYLSMAALFQSVLPGYPIREITDKEKQVQHSKDVRRLWKFESTLLQRYKAFLASVSAGLKTIKTDRRRVWKRLGGLRASMAREAAAEGASAGEAWAASVARELVAQERRLHVLDTLATALVQCLCVMLSARPYFNFRNDVLKWVVAQMVSPIAGVASLTIKTLCELFENDPRGELTLHAVTAISGLIKARQYNVPAAVVRSFLSLNLSDSRPEAISMRGIRSLHENLSRKEKKKRKEQKRLEKELKESNAVLSKEERQRMQTEILQAVFLTYFRVLKKGQRSPIISQVLTCLSKQAHLINVEFMMDLTEVLRVIASDPDQDVLVRLRAIMTVFALVQGPGRALRLDLSDFFRALYEIVCFLVSSWTSGESPHTTLSEEDRASLSGGMAHATTPFIPLVLKALETVFTDSRKHLSAPRVSAFVKQVLAMSLVVPPNEALALMHAVHRIVLRHPALHEMLESEKTAMGRYRPDVYDPQHCNAMAASLWEIFQLKRHYHPAVRAKAHALASLADIPPRELQRDTGYYIRAYSTTSGNFNPPPATPKPHPLAKRVRKIAKKAKKKDRARSVFVRPAPPNPEANVPRTFARTPIKIAGFKRHFARTTAYKRANALVAQKEQLDAILALHQTYTRANTQPSPSGASGKSKGKRGKGKRSKGKRKRQADESSSKRQRKLGQTSS